jgi:hypothetical protein
MSTTTTAPKPAAPKMTKTQYRALWKRAKEAGEAAAKACTPTPMIVGTPTHPLGNDIDPTKRVYYVPQGVCGFAWISIHPATSGFVRWMKSQGIGRRAYGGGWQVWVSGYGQSMEKKSAYAGAVAAVLQEAGFKAYGESRMD